MNLVIDKKTKLLSLDPKHVSPYKGPVLQPAEPRSTDMMSQYEWSARYNVYISKIVAHFFHELETLQVDGHDIYWNKDNLRTYFERFMYKTSRNTLKQYYFLK